MIARVEFVDSFEPEREHIKQSRLFDTQQFDARRMTRLGFFGHRDKDSVLPLHDPWSNLYLPGEMPSGRSMQVTGVLVETFGAQSPFAQVIVPELRFATLWLQLLDKIYIQRTDLLALAPTAPTVKFDPRDVAPLLIPPAMKFGVEIMLPLQSPFDMHAHSDLLMRVSLIGELERAIS